MAFAKYRHGALVSDRVFAVHASQVLSTAPGRALCPTLTADDPTSRAGGVGWYSLVYHTPEYLVCL